MEDDLNIRRLTGMHLQLAGYDVRELEDAAAAREALKKEQPALVLLDIMMPGEDGFSCGWARRTISSNPLSRQSCWPGWRTR